MNITIRPATLDDIETLVRLRLAYIRADMGAVEEEQTVAVSRQLRRYLPVHLTDGSFVAMLAEHGEEAVGTAFLAISQKPASPYFLNGLTGTVMNVYTLPSHRRQGIATAMMRELIARARGCGVTSLSLSATADGVALYHGLGFRDLPYTAMELSIE